MSNEVLFSGLVKCGLCQSNMRAKLDGKNKRRIYICSNYHNYKNCRRIPVDQGYIMELLSRRFNKRLTHDEIQNEVDYIEVFDKWRIKDNGEAYKLTIHLKNKEDIILDDTYLQI